MIADTLNDLANLCLNGSQQIATAESCTGGLVAKLITDLAGSSQWFERGFVTYSNLAKEQMLGVDKQLLTDFGAVSEAVAEAMARGALIHSQAQFALSITGIAGPGGGSKTKPVGMVCFGWAYYSLKNNSLKNNEIVSTTSSQLFSGDRQAVRNQSALFALQNMVKIITDNPVC
ncbi:MAG: nicotinamide-nucleotide amidohydrolase family protein [Gammaproteobacteria bacterium]|nr:nicotinamide-nucleotide amidohydrolase family protein [Gammaproteobacteria bacterium]